MKNISSKRVRVSDRIGIKWKMFALLMLFLVLAVFVIWVFQIQMLSNFYQRTKFNELNFSGTAISAQLGDNNATVKTAETYAEEYHVDIWVYSIEGELAHQIVEAKGADGNDIRYLDQHFRSMYEKALINGGTYTAVVPTDVFEQRLQLQIISDNFENPDSFPNYRRYSGEVTAVSFSLYEADGEKYALMQSANLTPVKAMVKTMNDQFTWIGVALIVLVLIFAEVMSQFITKPFVKMNKAAKQLAKGRYDVEFTGHGYKEISELGETLNYASVELSKSDLLRKELLSNVSHDLRTPLTMIKGYSEVMRDIPGENTPENIQVIIDETERLTALVNDVLDLSKLQSGTQRPALEIFSLTDTVRSVMNRYEKLTMQDGYRIEFIATRNVDVCADRGMILQAVYNLINNAIHYTGENKYVCVSQTVIGDNVRISVTDTGDGIPPEQIEQIWDRYYKIDKVHKRAFIGTGLGLSIVKGVLELHNASYGVESVQGSGSTFWFELTTVTAEVIDNNDM